MLRFDLNRFPFFLALSGQFKYSFAKRLQSTVGTAILPTSLGAVLGATGCYLLVSAVLTPQIAQAYTERLEVSLTLQAEESYESLLSRAESVARAAAQRSFDRDVLVTEVEVTILGQNGGAIAPIFLLEVSRQAWRNRPDPQVWATYFPTSKSLLEIEDNSELADQNQPATPASTSTPPEPTIRENPDNLPGQPPSPAPSTEAQPNAIPQPAGSPIEPEPSSTTPLDEQPANSEQITPDSDLPEPNPPTP